MEEKGLGTENYKARINVDSEGPDQGSCCYCNRLCYTSLLPWAPAQYDNLPGLKRLLKTKRKLK